jgi:hypothetical protein
MSTLAFPTKPAQVDAFRKFLTARGCEVLEPTNPWEVIRFKANGRTNVVYRNKRGLLTPNGDDVTPAALSFTSSGLWTPSPKASRGGRRKRLRIVEQIGSRDGWDCFFCGQPLGDNITVEEFFSIAHGGVRHVANCALAHKDCNIKAGHLSVVEKVKLRDRLRGPAEDAAAAIEFVGALNDLRADRGLPPIEQPLPLRRAA